MKTIILGVGNPILCDDGVGIHVVNHLKQQITDPNVTLDEAMTGGMNLLDMIVGYDRAILIDAINLKKEKDGQVKRFHLADFHTMHSCNPHDLGLQEAITLAKRLGETKIPKEIIVIGIVLKEIPYIFGEQLRPVIAEAVPKAARLVEQELKKTSTTQKYNANTCT